MSDFKMPTEEELKAKLTPEEYHVLREGGTELPNSGAYVDTRTDGTYACKVCGNPLFPSTAKFDTNIPGLAGWPSFEDALPGAVVMKEDTTLGMHRTEITCARCGSHLGHLFDDKSETKTGKHYCVNSVCLDLEKKP
ncbi:MAG: peptide-methionine (R)-S-oxide reductase MsrB [Patescibacteria group bacterium]